MFKYSSYSVQRDILFDLFRIKRVVAEREVLAKHEPLLIPDVFSRKLKNENERKNLIFIRE